MMTRVRTALLFCLASATLARGPVAARGDDAADATATSLPATRAAADEPRANRRAVDVDGTRVQYLVIPPAASTPPAARWMVVFLHGAGGSINDYNLARPPYARLRAALSAAGATVVVPGLGKLHFMNDAAKRAMARVIATACADEHVDPAHVHLMGASMGAGSALAYAVSIPGAARSVCAIFPMTDMATFAVDRPSYAEPLRLAYGGTPAERPEAYAANSALGHADALAKIPIFLIHGTADRGVPVAHSERLAAALAALGGRCTLVKVEGGTHKDVIVEDHQDEIARFLIEANR